MQTSTVQSLKGTVGNLLNLTMNHIAISLHIESLYPPRFSLQCGEQADINAWRKGYEMFIEAIAAIHNDASGLAKLDYVSKSKLAEIQISEHQA